MSLISRGMSVTTYQELSEYRNLFSCLLCVEFFSNPRVLDCHHTFCEQCLESYYSLFNSIHLHQQQGIVMPCPICRQVTTALAGGPLPLDMTTDRVMLTRRKLSRQTEVTPKCDPCNLRDRNDSADFFCNKCALNMCRNCRTTHDQHHLFVGHAVIHVSNKETLDLHCDTHSKMPSIYFCLDCNVPACVVCILHNHSDHQTSKLRDALSIRRDHLKTLLNEFGPRLDKTEAKVKRLATLVEEGSCIQRSKTVTKINGMAGQEESDEQRIKNPDFERLCKGTNSISILSKRIVRSSSSPANCSLRNTTLMGERGGTSGRKSQDLKCREWFIDEGVSNSSSSDSSRDSVMQYTCTRTVDAPESVVRTNSLHNQRNSDANLKTNGEKDRAEKKVAISPTPQGAVTSFADETDLSSGSKTETLNIMTLQTTRHRKLFNLSTKILEMSQSKKLFAIYEDIVDRIQTVLDTEMQYIQDFLDELIALAMVHQRSSSSSSEHSNRDIRKIASKASLNADVESAPKSMLVRPKLLWKVERQRSDITEMWNPCDVAFLQDDESTIVAEYDNISDRNNKLQLFDRTGRPLAVIAQGQIQPLGVAVTRDGQIAVTDCKGKRIKILTTAGQTVTEIGKGQFGWPYGIAVNSRGQLIVTDAFNDTVSIYQMDGKRLKMFGSTGSQNSQFRNPYHVTVDARDNIIVSDSGNSCIKVFDASGKFRFHASEANRKSSADVTGERTVKRRKLRGPRGVTVDLKGNILVADDCSRVCMFDSNGRYVRNLLTDEDSVKFPEAVHCSDSGLLAVTEWNPSNMFAIKMFNMYE